MTAACVEVPEMFTRWDVSTWGPKEWLIAFGLVFTAAVLVWSKGGRS